jgi:hypothetical protein
VTNFWAVQFGKSGTKSVFKAYSFQDAANAVNDMLIKANAFCAYTIGETPEYVESLVFLGKLAGEE